MNKIFKFALLFAAATTMTLGFTACDDDDDNQVTDGAVTGEALMAGAKVVVSRKAGSADLVREGENGFVVDPTDVDGLTERLGQLLDAVPFRRPPILRENLLPYRFADCVDRLIESINAL